MKFQNKWICSDDFVDLKPLNLLHKQLSQFNMPKHREDLLNHHTLFRKKINLPTGKKAVLNISADDYYKLYINGKYITQGPANSYAFCYNYNAIDVTAYLHHGYNCICIHVFYQGLVNRAYNSGDYRQGMIADLYIDDMQILDNNWKYHRALEYKHGDTYGYETQFVDIIDNRLKSEGWTEIDFDDTLWSFAPIKADDDHILIEQITPNLQTEIVYPSSVKKLANGLLIDFGKELTGEFYAEFTGTEAQTVYILHGEELDTENTVRFNMRCNCNYKDTLILKQGKNSLVPYDYKSFRYVQLIMDKSIAVDNIYVRYRHFPFNETTFKYNNPSVLLSSILEICKNAVINCSQEAYLDCPQREKGQYLGDLTVTAHSHLCLSGDARLLKKALIDFSNSSKICSGLMAVSPGNFMQEISDFSLLYPYQLLLYYKYTNDCKLLKELLPTAQNMIDYFKVYLNADGLLENVKEKWNLVDWPDLARDDYDFDLGEIVGDGCHNVINALYCGALKNIETIKTILGISHENEFDKSKQQFIRTFYDAKTGLFKDSTVSPHCSLHSNVYPLFFDIAPQPQKIVEYIRKKQFSCSVYTSYYLLMALCQNQEHQLAYDLIVNKSDHSWYNMIIEGATCTFESWGKEQKQNTSLCHAWASSPIPVLSEYAEYFKIIVDV